ncbi:MAG: SDR family NAD(P)-dependent oxidoreductase [Elusimicrobia bacterium]|nr:SDR family NAD(P)-dependent oxidoreductase [Elusimicrobiota bacterium]
MSKSQNGGAEHISIAIVGLGGIFPGAANVAAYWDNIIGGKNLITNVPLTRWDWRLYWNPDPKMPDKTYSKIGGFITDFHFDPLEHRIPPQVAAQMDSVQQLAVAATRQALQDAGYLTKTLDPERTAVIFGNSMGGPKKDASDFRVYAAQIESAIKSARSLCHLESSVQTDLIKEVCQTLTNDNVRITEDTMPGELSNVIAGRVANVFNFHGANFTVDAACASSLAAVDMAVKSLLCNDHDAVICGGVDQMMSPPSYVKFSKIGALSPDGSYPFDNRANGFVMGEGAGILILKRLDDAIRDGDKIYAVIRGIGSSSDGRGRAITAPNPKGQKLAVERAFRNLDYTPGAVELVEAHGTSTRVGDKTEVGVLTEVFGPYAAAKQATGLGSVKSQIGHLKAAAGAAGMVKIALALSHKVLPPSINFEIPNSEIDFGNSPFRVITQAQEWKTKKEKRRANVSAFGFGGTNFHVALEEFDPSKPPSSRVSDETASLKKSSPYEIAQIPASPRPRNDENAWPRAFIFSDETPQGLLGQLGSPQDAARIINPAMPWRAAFAAENPKKFKEKAAILKSALQNPDAQTLNSPALKLKGIFIKRQTGQKTNAKIGFIFPGQGSQYVNMMKDLSQRYEVVRQTFEEADAILEPLIHAKLTGILFAPEGETQDQIKKREERIKQTEITQPAVLTADVAIYRLLASLGVKPDVVCGHSLGEYGALVASGILNFHDALIAVSARAKEMAAVNVPDAGKMASVSANVETVEPVLKTIPGYVVVANKNCPSQTVIGGDSQAVQEAVRIFQNKGIAAQTIAVSHAFHSAIVAPAEKPYREFLSKLTFGKPRIPVLSNVTADYYPEEPEKILELLSKQISHPVEFIRQIQRMHQDGVRIFIEAGPKRVLTALVTAILEGKSGVAALASNHPKKGGVYEFQELMARLFCEGAAVNWPEKNPPEAPEDLSPAAHSRQDRPVAVISGIAAGGPGTWDQVFREGFLDELLRGQNLIERVPEDVQKKQIDKNIVRLVKSASGHHAFESIKSTEATISLAGQAGDFDLAKEFGVPQDWAESMDRTFQMALAVGLLALKDAGIPLVEYFRETTTGKKISKGWKLPESLAHDTGVIFASAFPGYESLVTEVSRFHQAKANGGDYLFPRDFLLRVLALGHSRLAQWIGAKGPSACVNAACASTTQAVALAEDWIRLGRAKRVVVAAADDISNPNLMDWFASGFLISGAATTKAHVSRAALPFDKRRHGMIIGMGAAGLVVEADEELRKRGTHPLAKILATEYANSAFHVTRLDLAHVAQVMERLISRVEKEQGISRDKLAESLLFMSHETYTPARGGSAQAETDALKKTFGANVSKVIVANTKGFTGHSMGAGIEDPLAVWSLVSGEIPPIANYKEPDADLAGITLSPGGKMELTYALRLAAGFGSQLAMTFIQKAWTRGVPRIYAPKQHLQWLGAISGIENPECETVNNTLRLKGTAKNAAPAAPEPEKKPAGQIPAAAAPAASNAGERSVQETVVSLVSEKTGYPKEMLELDLDMEADLGIDTVKQAELFGMIRERFGIPRKEGLSLKDYPTIRHVIRFALSNASYGFSAGESPLNPVAERGPASTRGEPSGLVLGSGGKGDSPALNLYNASNEKKVDNPSDDKNGFKRKIPSLRAETFSPAPLRQLDRTRPILVAGAKAEICQAFETALKTRGFSVITLDPRTEHFSPATPLGGVFYLEGLSLEENLAPRNVAIPLMRLAKAVHKNTEFFLVLTAMDGRHGLSAGRFNPLAGILTGFAKSLAKEWDGVAVKALDLDPQLTTQEMAGLALKEMESATPAVEVALKANARWVIETKEEPSGQTVRKLAHGTKILITGGAQGVGFEFAKALAKNLRPSLIILGRTEIPPEAQAWAGYSSQKLQEVKNRLWENLKNSQAKATPVLLEREFSKITKAAQVFQNLETLKTLAGSVEYIRCDVSQEEELAETLKKICQRHPSIDMVAHAAGIEESKLLSDKTPENFERVFDTKAAGACQLTSLIPKTPGQIWIFFGSIAGRFGNVGQTDYSAACDYLAKLAWTMTALGRRTFTFDLTAISETGMATKPAVKTALETIGIEFMAPSAAVSMMLQEISTGKGGEVVLTGSLGRFEQRTAEQPAGKPASGQTKTDSKIVLQKTFSLQEDLYLDDHRVAATPYVPGVMGLELFAQLGSRFSDIQTSHIQNVRFNLPIKLLRDRPVSVRVIAEKAQDLVELSIESDFITPAGIKLGAPKEHFHAQYVPARNPSVWEDLTKPAIAPKGLVLSEDIYKVFFHGPRFRVLKQILALENETILAEYQRPQAPLWNDTRPKTHFYPTLIEAAFQTCGWYDQATLKKTTLPDAIDHVQIYSYSQKAKNFYVYGIYKGADGGKSVYDTFVFDEEGQLWVELAGYKTIRV